MRKFSFAMTKTLCLTLQIPLAAILAAGFLAGQTTEKAQGTTSSLERAVDLAAKGHCPEALPLLKRSLSGLTDKQLEYRAAMATARCAMSLDQAQTAVNALWILKRDFPKDPEVLYIMTHYFSQLATRAAQEMAAVAPTSYQAHELEAESLESQENWDAAGNEYRKILERDPNLPGIHYRLGRVALSKTESVANTEEARKEFEAELKIDSSNAAATFWLGELARRAGQWDQAISHFGDAARLDSGFAEAFLALGMARNSAERFSEAVAPLERYVKMVPADAAGHYQLSIAYARTGRKEEAVHEMAIQQKISEKNPDGIRP
jgi:tetratricopeptide (TPR) repeat protein